MQADSTFASSDSSTLSVEDPRIRRYVMRAIKNSRVPVFWQEDALQDIMASLIRRPCPVHLKVVRIRSEVLDCLRRYGPRTRYGSSRIAQPLIVTVDGETSEHNIEDGFDFATLADSIADLARGWRRLSERQRVILALCATGSPTKAIAQRLEISSARVGQVAHTARLLLSREAGRGYRPRPVPVEG